MWDMKEKISLNLLALAFLSLSLSLPCRGLGGGVGAGPVPLHTSLEQYGMNLQKRRQSHYLAYTLGYQDNENQLRLLPASSVIYKKTVLTSKSYRSHQAK